MVTQHLLIATRNRGKQAEIEVMLRDIGRTVVFPDDIGLDERIEEDRLEVEDTFAGNARRKAEYFARRSGLPTAADDSGLEVFALGGLPGVRSRRFAMHDGPPDEQDTANNDELLRRLAGLPPEKRRARYRCVVAYVSKPGSASATFDGSCTGQILEHPEGSGGFGYDPLFWSDDLQKSFGMATPEEKHGVSHRGRAFHEFALWLQAGE